MRSNNPNATHFLMRRNFFIGVAVFLVIFFTLPMWALSHIPEGKADILQYYLPDEVEGGLTRLVSQSAMQHEMTLEARCFLYGALGFLTAVMLFRHLFSRKQGMLQASLPDKRETDFLRRLAAYGVLGIGPIVLNYVLYLLIVTFNGLLPYLDWGYVLSRLGILLLVNLYGFALGLLASVLTGTWWAALLAGAVLVVGFEGLSYVWYIITGKYLHTFVGSGYEEFLKKYSPTVSLYKSVFMPEGANLLPGIISIAVSLGAGFGLYRIRKTEATEKTLAFPWLHTVMGFILPLMGGSIMGIILMYSFANETGLLLGLVLGAVLTYVVCRLVFEQRFGNLFKHWYLPVAAALVLVLGVAVLHTDVLGYDHYLPGRDEVQAITYQPVGYRDSGENITLTGTEAVDAAYAWCDMMRGEVDGMENGLYEADAAVTDSSVVVTYHLKGRTVMRRYPNQAVRNDAQLYLETIIESDDYKRSLLESYHLVDDTVNYMYLSPQTNLLGRDEFYARFGVLPDMNLNRSQDSVKINAILTAYREDVNTRTFAEKKKRELFTMDISWRDEETGYESYVNAPVFAGDENVLKAIFGDKAKDVVEYFTGGYAADENMVVLQLTHSESRRAVQEMGVDSFELLESVKAASSPEEAMEWIRGAQHSSQHRRYFMPDYEDRSSSILYIYDLNRLQLYQAAGDTFELPEDVTQMAYDRTIPVSLTLYCIGK